MTTAPPELAALRERLAELSDLHGLGSLLFWDQNVMMPPGGAVPRAEQAATLAKLVHVRETDPELRRLLTALEPWADGEDPDSDDVRLVRWTRRDSEKAARVPTELAMELTRAKTLGQQAWQEARQANDFALFRDALARHVELRHEYVACFESFDHPYDVLLDDFEPGLTTAELRPLLAGLREELVPLVAEVADPDAPSEAEAFGRPHPAARQAAAVRRVLDGIGFEPGRWRLDTTVHPFAMAVAPTDVRITTRYIEDDFSFALFSALHEFGHGLYEASVDPALTRTTLDSPVSLGVHESQSRLWENLVGRSQPFVSWLLPQLRETLGGAALDRVDEAGLHRALNRVRPSLIRIEADETTYNLHVLLRFELEIALMEGTLAVDDVPAAWAQQMQLLLGLEVPSPLEGVLQDVHWSAGLIGYFPTYALGNLMAAQMWERLAEDLGDVDDQFARGEFAPLREWLREHVHRHGRKFPPRELLRRVTGDDLRAEPFLRYLRAKLAAVA